MSKINTGKRSKADDAKALEDLKASVSGDQKVVVEDGVTYIVEKSQFGVTMKTRIA